MCMLTALASPVLRSWLKLLICYQTLSTGRFDTRLHPDLRIGLNDATHAPVVTLVR